MKVGVIGNAHKIKNERVIEELISRLQENGFETARFSSHREIENVDLVIVLGGDGAILHAATVAAPQNIPIVGVNYGNVGFLTEFEREEVFNVVELLLAYQKGDCTILNRSLLEVSVDGESYYALNEIAIQRDYACGTSPQILTIRVKTESGDIPLAGDGALLSTPTGSTAYSLSAGGAIITPEAPVFLLTPICAFSMSARPMVLSDDEQFEFTVEKGKALLLVDGKAVATLRENDGVTVKKAPFTAHFPTQNEKNFFNKIKNKLNG
ncbi:MAG: NAD(+)/NADH kinase [Clostridia bacterium]|nr:NAD(+)/NADH kinase [Clostridia bacterium]